MCDQWADDDDDDDVKREIVENKEKDGQLQFFEGVYISYMCATVLSWLCAFFLYSCKTYM